MLVDVHDVWAHELSFVQRQVRQNRSKIHQEHRQPAPIRDAEPVYGTGRAGEFWQWTAWASPEVVFPPLHERGSNYTSRASKRRFWWIARRDGYGTFIRPPSANTTPRSALGFCQSSWGSPGAGGREGYNDTRFRRQLQDQSVQDQINYHEFDTVPAEVNAFLDALDYSQ